MSTPAPDSTFTPATGLLAGLELLQISQDGAVLHIRLNRPVKRNAINDGLIAQLHTAFVNLPADVRAVVVSGEGAHFCAGLDLSELVERDIHAAILHSRGWHAAFDAIQFGRVPVIAVLHDREMVRKHFPRTLALAGRMLAWGDTASVLAEARA